jgi:hypothetical protein
MNQFWRGTWVLVGLSPACVFAGPRTDINSFLDTPVSSTPQLVNEVQANSEVRDRYLRHYGMTQTELVSYLRTLKPSRLAQAKTVTVFGVPDSGVFHVRDQHLHKGDFVFVDQHGHGALVGKCGNPMSLGPTNVRNMALAMPPIEELSAPTLQALPALTVNPEFISDNRPALAMYVPPDTLADVVSDIPPVTTTVVTAPTPPPAPVPPPPPSSNNGNPLGILPWLGGAGLIGILTSHHGGGGPPIVPVPEPASLVCLSVGAVALLKRRRNR